MEAAGEIFARDGFARATIRKICSRAGVNIALVSYHFGDKEGLYIEVLKHYRAKAHEEYPPDLGMDDTSSPEQRIGAFIRSLTFRLLKPGSSSCFWQIFAREFIEPTAAFDTMVEETIRLAGPGVAETALMRCAASIVGQCLYYRNSRQVISRLVGRGSFAVKEIEEISDHITLFSLSALRSFHGGVSRQEEGVRLKGQCIGRHNQV
jgi:AcrR family transcriptional regulator